MSKYELDIPEESPCQYCSEDVPLTAKICPKCNEELPQRVNSFELLYWFTKNLILDARPGGLVIGRDTPEDDIGLYLPVVTGVIEIAALIQGGEFILNVGASVENRDRLAEINSYTSSDYTPMESIPLSPTTRIFNTNGTGGPETNLVLLGDTGQAVINRAATIKYFTELVEINNSAHAYYG